VGMEVIGVVDCAGRARGRVEHGEGLRGRLCPLALLRTARRAQLHSHTLDLAHLRADDARAEQPAGLLHLEERQQVHALVLCGQGAAAAACVLEGCWGSLSAMRAHTPASRQAAGQAWLEPQESLRRCSKCQAARAAVW